MKLDLALAQLGREASRALEFLSAIHGIDQVVQSYRRSMSFLEGNQVC